MEIVEGVNLHLIKNESLKTVHIKCRFSGQLRSKTVARRALVAQMLETATMTYPTNQAFRLALANLFGASLSTTLVTKGKTHCLDINCSVISDSYSFESQSLLEALLNVLKDMLFIPLVATEQYQKASFEVEKQNLMAAIDSENADLFYLAEQGLRKGFYQDSCQALSSLTTKDLLSREDAFTAYQEFQRMLHHDQIDVFIVGDFDDYDVIKQLHQFPFGPRQVALDLQYQQVYTNVISERCEIKESQQSILMLGYHMPFSYDAPEMLSLAVYNALLGDLPTSKLFVNVREKTGLTYAIGSYYDDFSQLTTIYAGIQKTAKTEVLRLILRQVKEMRLGKFTVTDLDRAKLAIKNQLLVSQDSPNQLIEMAFRDYYSQEDLSIERLLIEIDAIDKNAIVAVAKKLRLQAVHLLEGVS
ncbi:EF-P 5-aminopentanol modification-associated protein YfmF [Streptococcus pluranimalium]